MKVFTSDRNIPSINIYYKNIFIVQEYWDILKCTVFFYLKILPMIEFLILVFVVIVVLQQIILFATISSCSCSAENFNCNHKMNLQQKIKALRIVCILTFVF